MDVTDVTVSRKQSVFFFVDFVRRNVKLFEKISVIANKKEGNVLIF